MTSDKLTDSMKRTLLEIAEYPRGTWVPRSSRSAKALVKKHLVHCRTDDTAVYFNTYRLTAKGWEWVAQYQATSSGERA